MRTSIPYRTVILSLMAAALSFNACIYEAPGDDFYRTLWSSSKVPLGPFDIDELTLEFHCGNKITITDGFGSIITQGTYNPDGRTAVFTDLQVILDDICITFLEAHLNDDILFLLWRPDNMLYPFTTSMERQTGYEPTN